MTVHTRTTKDDVRQSWTFHVPTTGVPGALRCATEWAADMSRSRQERLEAVSRVTQAILALIQRPDGSALIDLSPKLASVCDDDEHVDLFVRGVLGIGATSACRMARHLIPIEWPLEASKQLVLRKVIYDRGLRVFEPRPAPPPSGHLDPTED